MEVLPVDIAELLAIFMGTSMVLIPVIGLTLRFALKPTVEALMRMFDHRGLDETVAILERRLELQEQQIEAMTNELRRVGDAADFHERLASGKVGDETTMSGGGAG